MWNICIFNQKDFRIVATPGVYLYIVFRRDIYSLFYIQYIFCNTVYTFLVTASSLIQHVIKYARAHQKFTYTHRRKKHRHTRTYTRVKHSASAGRGPRTNGSGSCIPLACDPLDRTLHPSQSCLHLGRDRIKFEKKKLSNRSIQPMIIIGPIHHIGRCK